MTPFFRSEHWRGDGDVVIGMNSALRGVRRAWIHALQPQSPSTIYTYHRLQDSAMEQLDNATGSLGKWTPLRIPSTEREPRADQTLNQDGTQFHSNPMRCCLHLETMVKVLRREEESKKRGKWGGRGKKICYVDETFSLHWTSMFKINI